MEILNIKNLNFKYPNSSDYVLQNINLSVAQGEFIVLFGKSGSGKTTLLRLLKKELSPVGEKSGDILYLNKDLSKLSILESAKNIGYIMQNPRFQIVTNKVSCELAFGLENICEKPSNIKRIVAETSDFFGISHLYNEETKNLSGGQMQILNLASIMAMQPKMLLLDEPLSQLDPISAKELINMLKRLNEELSITIIIAEHRLEELLPIADKAVFLQKGKIKIEDTAYKVCQEISSNKDYIDMLKALPISTQIYNNFKIETKCPITIKDGRGFITKNFNNNILELKKNKNTTQEKNNSIIKVNNACFRYNKKSKDILKDLSICFNKGEVSSILGSNGSGKTTLLKMLCGIIKPYCGNIKLEKGIKVLYLPQNPIDLLIKDTVREDLTISRTDIKENEINKICSRLDINHLLDKNPMEISGGELQKVAIAKLLMLKADVILIDEPTKGIDVYAKENLINIIKELKQDKVTVIIVTHDIEFASNVSDKCMLLFDGSLVAVDTPNKFFSNNTFYQTNVGKITKNIYNNIINMKDLSDILTLNGRKED